MSVNGGGGRAGASVGAGLTTTAKMLQNIKEIVGGNFPEDEIYAMLRDCNMDPSETVHRLLNQDIFHEVKSKREKKKESKDIVESRARGANNNSNRGGRGVADYSGRIGSIHVSSSEYGGNRSKPIQKKENGPGTIPSSSGLDSSIDGSSITKSCAPSSDSIVTGNTGLLAASADTISSQYSARIQCAWSGLPGQRTLADIVKMGKPPCKTPRVPVAQTELYTSHNINASKDLYASTDSSAFMVPPLESPPEDSVANVAERVHEPGVSVGQHMSEGAWLFVDQSPVGNGPSLLEIHDASAGYDDQSTSLDLLVDEVSLHYNSVLDKTRATEGNLDGANVAEDSVRPVASSDGCIEVDNSVEGHGIDGVPLKNVNTYQTQLHCFDHHEDTTSAASSLQQLSLHEEAHTAQTDENPGVIFPNNLQIANADCSHLSFGSFGSGVSASFSGSLTPEAPNNPEVPSETADPTSVGPADARDSEYFGNEQLRPISNENVDSRPSTNPKSYEIPSSHPDIIGSGSSDAAEGFQYRSHSLASGYTFTNATQTNAASYVSGPENSQIQNLAPFPGVMQGSTSSSPSNLLTSTVRPAREFDLPYSDFLAAQSMPAKYSTSLSSIKEPSISMLEVVEPGVFSTTQPVQQNLSTASLPTGPTVPQHLPLQSYSQPTLPLGHLANIIGYPFLPQSYTYMPPAAFQQAYSGNSVFNQSLAAVHGAGLKYTLPQYKTGVTVSNLPQAAAVPSGLGSSANILGNFALNPSTSSRGTIVGYEDVLSSQYKDGNHYVPLQQNESSALWLHGGGSRTMPAAPARTYYGFQGQSQHSSFRQTQQPQPSPYGAVGYPNLYQSQAGSTQEHQQSTGDGGLGASRGVSSSQVANQMWQHNY